MFCKKMGKKMVALLLALSCVTAAVIPGVAEEEEVPALEPGVAFGEPAEWNPPEGATIYTLETVNREMGQYNPITGERTPIQTRFSADLLGECQVSFYVDGNSFVLQASTPSKDGVVRDQIGLMTLKLLIWENALWKDKLVSTDLYNYDASSHTLTRRITVAKGHHYRIYAEHYAQDDLVFGLYNYDKEEQYSVVQYISND